MKYKVGVWGQYGNGGKIADGQAVRTTVMTNELKMRYGEKNIGIANTNGWNKRPVRFFASCVKLIANSEIVMVLPADRGFKVFVPMLMIINSLFHRKLIYVVIGGFLPELLKEKPVYKKMVMRFDALFVQTKSLKHDLKNMGMKHVHILSNLKRLNTRRTEELKPIYEKMVKVCLFSRITKDKGVEDAIEAVRLANMQLGGNYIKLDCYGLLPHQYRETFAALIEKNNDILAYQGIIDFDKTVETLQNYFAMLFPTYYHGEGFPGNVIDAYNTGIPIIATDWMYNADVIQDGRNGIFVPIKNPQAICDALLKLYNDRELAYRISLNNLEDSGLYHPDRVMRDLYRLIEDGCDAIE